MTRPGGFPRLKRPDHKPAPAALGTAATSAEVVTASTESAQALPPMPTPTRYQLPRPVKPLPTLPRATQAAAPAPMQLPPAAEPEFDEEGRLIITAPLSAPARPVPTVLDPRLPCRLPPPPPRPPGSGLMRRFRMLADAGKQEPPPTTPPTPAPAPQPGLSMNDAGKFALRRPANKPQPASASTQKLPPLTADDIPD